MSRVHIRGAVVAAAIGLLAIFLTACGSGDEATGASGQEPAAAAKEYRAFLDAETKKLVFWITWMKNEIEDDEINAESRYASSRVPYGHLKPMAVLLPGLDGRINGSTREGYHRIERALWGAESMKGLTPVAKRLLADTKSLRRQIMAAKLEPLRLANAINRTLAQLSASAVLGKEEPYAHIDLVDVAATVEGARAAFKALKPVLLEAGHTDLAKEIEQHFDKTYRALSDFGVPAWEEEEQPRLSSPGTSMVLYIERSDAEHRWLGKHVDALAEPLTKVPALLAAE